MNELRELEELQELMKIIPRRTLQDRQNPLEYYDDIKFRLRFRSKKRMTSDQKEYLIAFMSANPKLVQMKFSPSFTFAKAEGLWDNLVTHLNQLGINKTKAEWKKTWRALKTSAKSSVAMVRKSSVTTGGGIGITSYISPSKEQIMSITGGMVAVEGTKKIHTFPSLLPSDFAAEGKNIDDDDDSDFDLDKPSLDINKSLPASLKFNFDEDVQSTDNKKKCKSTVDNALPASLKLNIDDDEDALPAAEKKFKPNFSISEKISPFKFNKKKQQSNINLNDDITAQTNAIRNQTAAMSEHTDATVKQTATMIEYIAAVTKQTAAINTLAESFQKSTKVLAEATLMLAKVINIAQQKLKE